MSHSSGTLCTPNSLKEQRGFVNQAPWSALLKENLFSPYSSKQAYVNERTLKSNSISIQGFLCIHFIFHSSCILLLQSCDIEGFLYISKYLEWQLTADSAMYYPQQVSQGEGLCASCRASWLCFILAPSDCTSYFTGVFLLVLFVYNLFSFSCWGRTKAFKKHPPIILPVGLVLKIVLLFPLHCLSCRDLSTLFKIHHTICRQGNSFEQMKWVCCEVQREKCHGQRDSKSNFADFE